MIERESTEIPLPDNIYVITQCYDRADGTCLIRQRLLPSGNTLGKKEWVYDEQPGERSYEVYDPEGHAYGFSMTVYDDDPNRVHIGWVKEPRFPDSLNAINDYFLTISEMSRKKLSHVGVKTRSEYSQGDLVEEGKVSFPITFATVEAIAEQHDECLSSVDDIYFTALGGKITDSGWYVRLVPTIPKSVKSNDSMNAIQSFFEATSIDPTTLPHFTELLTEVLTEEEITL